MRIDLNNEWDLYIGKEKFEIQIPSAIQNLEKLKKKYPCEAMPNSFLGDAVFEKNFSLNEKSKKYILTFMGVMPYANVFVNGKNVGEIKYCQTAFNFDISADIIMGQNTIRVELSEKNLELIGGMRFDVLNWSGIFDRVYLECEDIVISHPEVVCKKNSFIIRVLVDHASKVIVKILNQGEYIAFINDNTATVEIPLDAYQKWSVENPVLYTAEIYAFHNGDCGNLKFQFGLRDIQCVGNRIKINDIPFFAFGGGDEYFSPTISPLIDKNIIRKRFRKFKEMGFNFYRYHTHSPTQAELEICDELGVMVSIEIPILSNFNRIKNIKMGYEILENYVLQTRTHPCILDYCLGNEGAQLLVKDKNEHEIAAKGYSIIKKNTKNQLAMICFGYQGETPELENDIMSPHLWSQEFRWAYCGLAKTPWSFLRGALDNKPCIVHEFGKYGVFPNDEESNIMPATGYRLNPKENNDMLFEGSSLSPLRKKIIKNSEKLSVLCAKTAFESMRRQSGISGYIYWTVFRMGLRCGGLCDDMGNRMNCSAKNLADTANAPIGIFADRDYYGRTFYCGEKAQFNITVSNFSQSDIEQAKLVCSLESDTVYFEKVFKNISSKMGEISNKANLEFVMPLFDNAKELSLNMRLVEKNRVLAQNRLQLWCYPNERIYNDTIIYHVHCSALEDNIEANINGATSIWNWISILLGCVIPEYGFIPTDEKIMDYLENSLKKRKPSLIICDKIDHISKFLSENGVPVLYIDSGNFSEELYPEKIPDHSFFDLGTFYTPFRAGWDEGNCATVLCGELFNEPKNDGFADLRYYASIQGSRGLFREKIIHILGLNNIKNTFHLIQKVKNRQLIQENASVYFERMQSKKINDLVYYVDGKVKETNTAVCSLNLFEDPCGKTLFNRIIKNLLIKEREDNE